MTNAEARCNKSLRPRKPEGSLGRTAQDVHLDSHTAPELRGTSPVREVNIARCTWPRSHAFTRLVAIGHLAVYAIRPSLNC